MAEFHIHVDAATVSPEFEAMVHQQLGFARDDFSPRPSAGIAAYPCNHLSRKIRNPRQFTELFDRVTELAQKSRGLTGYIEGECVVRRDEINVSASADATSPPFSLLLGELGTGEFRETEIHISTVARDIDYSVVSALVDAGFFLAWKGPLEQRKLVFTVQGKRLTIGPLYNVLVHWLSQSGALGQCVIKEEQIRRYWLSDPNVFRPPIVRQVLPEYAVGSSA